MNTRGNRQVGTAVTPGAATQWCLEEVSRVFWPLEF